MNLLGLGGNDRALNAILPLKTGRRGCIQSTRHENVAILYF
jgi:hypothetical protein